MPVKKIISIACALMFFTSLVAYPDIASDSAAEGLKMCAGLIIPTLFPFFVATKLVSGVYHRCYRWLSHGCFLHSFAERKG